MDFGILLLRVTVGLAMAAHGGQKVFGWFGGYGPDATGQFMEGMGFKPGRRHALTAGYVEVLSGVLLAIGFLTPLAAAMGEGAAWAVALRGGGRAGDGAEQSFDALDLRAHQQAVAVVEIAALARARRAFVECRQQRALRIAPGDEPREAGEIGVVTQHAAQAAALVLELQHARDARLARVVECRFFGGMSEEEIAEALGVTVRTVQRDWAKARMLLHTALGS